MRLDSRAKKTWKAVAGRARQAGSELLADRWTGADSATWRPVCAPKTIPRSEAHRHIDCRVMDTYHSSKHKRVIRRIHVNDHGRLHQHSCRNHSHSHHILHANSNLHAKARPDCIRLSRRRVFVEPLEVQPPYMEAHLYQEQQLCRR